MLVHASCTVLQPFFLDNLLLVVYGRSLNIWKSTILGDLEAHSIFGHRLFGDLCSNSPYGNQLLIFAQPSWQLALQPYLPTFGIATKIHEKNSPGQATGYSLDFRHTLRCYCGCARICAVHFEIN